MEDLWRRFQEALKHYTESTEDRKVAFETLRAKDEKSSKEIDAQMKKIQKLQVSAGNQSPYCLLLLLLWFAFMCVYFTTPFLTAPLSFMFPVPTGLLQWLGTDVL